MRLFKKEDEFIDRLRKVIAVSGIFFGVWAYFHTIHPVFQKEFELEETKNDVKILNQKISNLKIEKNTVEKEKNSIEKETTLLADQKKSLNVKIDTLQSKLKLKEGKLSSVESKLKKAESSAVLHKLQNYSDKIMSGYLSQIKDISNKSFNVVDYSYKVLNERGNKFDNEYEKKAYSFFKKYINLHKDEVVNRNVIVEYIVSLPYSYKIKLLKEKIKNN